MRILSQRKETTVKRIINRERIYGSLRTVQMVQCNICDIDREEINMNSINICYERQIGDFRKSKRVRERKRIGGGGRNRRKYMIRY